MDSLAGFLQDSLTSAPSATSSGDMSGLEDLLFGSGGKGNNHAQNAGGPHQIGGPHGGNHHGNNNAHPSAGASSDHDLASMFLNGDWSGNGSGSGNSNSFWESLGLMGSDSGSSSAHNSYNNAGDNSHHNPHPNGRYHQGPQHHQPNHHNNQRNWNNNMSDFHNNKPALPAVSSTLTALLGSLNNAQNNAQNNKSRDRVEQLMVLRRVEDSMRKGGATDEQIASALEAMLWKDLGAMKGGGYGPDRGGPRGMMGSHRGGYHNGPYGMDSGDRWGSGPTCPPADVAIPGTDRHCYTCARTFDYRRTHCDSCRAPLSVVDSKQNNWECPCGQPNWLWRKTCRRCLKPRAQGEERLDRPPAPAEVIVIKKEELQQVARKLDERPIWNMDHNVPKTTPAKRAIMKPPPQVLPPPSKSKGGESSSSCSAAEDPEVQEELRAWLTGAGDGQDEGMTAATDCASKEVSASETSHQISPQQKQDSVCGHSSRSSTEGKQEASSPELTKEVDVGEL
ncbi:unnamed protein product [Amoebophrya sp. A120]|nr:unnamed protein product [Amoebophrya sp. A120]|eukprot:GSA120T00023226001.1